MHSEDTQTPASDDRLIAGWEIFSIMTSFLMAEWVIRPFGNRDKLIVAIPLGIALVVMLLSHFARGETLHSIGWRLDNFWPAVRLMALPTGCGVGLIVLVGWLVKGFASTKWREWQWLAWVPVWALIQQYALHGFLNRRAQIVLGPGYRSILAVGVMFAVLHLPNPWLTLLTLIAGVLWAAVYQRIPNLFALSLSHALMSILLALALPAPLLRNLRVGFRYFG